MAKKKEELVQCKKCGKMEARVKHVIFDDDGSVYTQHPWMLGMIFMVVGIALIPRIPDLFKIPVGVALIIGGAVVVTRAYFKRRRLPRGREMYCHSCYHFWWEKDPINYDLPVNGKIVSLYVEIQAACPWFGAGRKGFRHCS